MRPNFGNLIANILGRRFLRHCHREMRTLAPDPKPVVARIRDHAQQVFDESVATLPDRQTRMIHAYCSLVLAAFREIRAVTDDDANAMPLRARPFSKPWKGLGDGCSNFGFGSCETRLAF